MFDFFVTSRPFMEDLVVTFMTTKKVDDLDKCTIMKAKGICTLCNGLTLWCHQRSEHLDHLSVTTHDLSVRWALSHEECGLAPLSELFTALPRDKTLLPSVLRHNALPDFDPSEWSLMH